MNILCVTHELARNGAVVCLLDATRHFRSQGHKVTIFVDGPRLEPARTLQPDFEALGAGIIWQADGQPYDVAIISTLMNYRWIGRLKGKVPVAWWIHEGTAVAKGFLGESGFRRALADADQLIYPNPHADRMFAPLFGDMPSDRRSIVSPVIPAHAPVPPATKATGRFRIVCVGTLCPRKRQSDLVTALASLEDLPVDCVLIGEKLSVDDTVGRAIESGRVTATGGLSAAQVQSYFASADLFSLPSGDEHFPMAPLEAGLRRLPILLSNLKCYDGIWGNGQNALIHPVGDELLLATFIRALFMTPALRDRLGLAAQKTAATYTEARFAAALDIALDATLAAGAGGAARVSRSGWRRFLGGSQRQKEAIPGKTEAETVLTIAEPVLPATHQSLRALPLPSPEIAELHSRAMTLMGAGDLAKAADLLRQALSQLPGDLRCLSTATMVFTFLKDHSEAEKLARQAVESAPGIPALHANLGNSLFAQGRTREALSSFRSALDLQPDLTAALLNCGHCHAALGEADMASRYFESVRAKAPSDAALLSAVGRAYIGLERLSEAEECLAQALVIDAGNSLIAADLDDVRARRAAGDEAGSVPRLKRKLVFSLEQEQGRL